ncbi:DUF3325 family protein [Stenotrophomonas acidaminiphila]|uniref:DUF3325 family protein n=1 Tax=Stenotrophomonas acidaminiphila TaxID=128780 RepID=UPI002F26DC88
MRYGARCIVACMRAGVARADVPHAVNAGRGALPWAIPRLLAGHPEPPKQSPRLLPCPWPALPAIADLLRLAHAARATTAQRGGKETPATQRRRRGQRMMVQALGLSFPAFATLSLAMEKHQQDLYGKAAASPARRRLWRRLGDAGRGRRPVRMRAGLGAGANLARRADRCRTGAGPRAPSMPSTRGGPLAWTLALAGRRGALG